MLFSFPSCCPRALRSARESSPMAVGMRKAAAKSNQSPRGVSCQRRR
nr:MAG TPA: hypothetical protein [Caudoviricetes sp.]